MLITWPPEVPRGRSYPCFTQNNTFLNIILNFSQVLGPKNVGLPLLIPITLLYMLIFLSGVIGNVAVCLVIIKNKSMHTATNYYLFSLAVSDLMILVLGKAEKAKDGREVDI